MTDSTRTSYFPAGEEEEELGLVQGQDEETGAVGDGRTPLDKTIDRIGMGTWSLLYAHLKS
jgi:hypothetical protein